MNNRESRADMEDEKRRMRNKKNKERRLRKKIRNTILDGQEVLVCAVGRMKPEGELRSQSYCALFKVDLGKGISEKLEPQSGPLYRGDELSRIVVSGSGIYMIGGFLGVFYIGTKGHMHLGASCWELDSGHGWKDIPLLENVGSLPNCVAYNGKIYVFRKKENGHRPFGEIYDPKVGCWKVISPPPPPGVKVFADPPLVDHANNRILVYVSELRSVFAYYPHPDDGDDDDDKQGGTWECVVDNKHLPWGRFFEIISLTALVDGVVYFYGFPCWDDDQPLKAFDLNTKEWLTIKFIPTHEIKSYREFAKRFDSFFALKGNGGLLCLARWSTDYANVNTQIFFLTFYVHRCSEAEANYVSVTPLKIQTIDIAVSGGVSNFIPLLG